MNTTSCANFIKTSSVWLILCVTKGQIFTHNWVALCKQGFGYFFFFLRKAGEVQWTLLLSNGLIWNPHAVNGTKLQMSLSTMSKDRKSGRCTFRRNHWKEIRIRQGQGLYVMFWVKTQGFIGGYGRLTNVSMAAEDPNQCPACLVPSSTGQEDESDAHQCPGLKGAR